MGFKCGIVGLPNVGKSTLFNALVQSISAEAANYMFCTIDPNIGKVLVPDERLLKIAKIVGSENILPTQIEFVDIAGLVEGASKGEGLGNRFLSHIREVDAVIHLVRCFEDDNITHVSGKVDPLSDLEIIELELILADLESIEKRLPMLEKKAKVNKDLLPEYELTIKVLEALKSGKPARTLLGTCDEKELQMLQLLTARPVLYVCNVAEEDVCGNAYTKLIKEVAEKAGSECIIVSAKIESEISLLTDENERKEFLDSLGVSEPGLSRLIRACYKLLDLITFFTAGPKETRAWTIMNRNTAPKAASVIHTDFEKGFIRAETISYEDFIKYNGELGAREAGKLRLEGKDYIVCDGDVMHFRFNT